MQNNSSRFHRFCNHQPEREEGFIFVAVVHQRPKRQPLRRSELQRLRRHSFGKRPVNMRRFAGIARILPINMPARLQFEVEASKITRARKEWSFAKDKLYVHMVIIEGTRRRPRGQANGQHKEKRENEAWKAHGLNQASRRAANSANFATCSPSTRDGRGSWRRPDWPVSPAAGPVRPGRRFADRAPCRRARAAPCRARPTPIWDRRPPASRRCHWTRRSGCAPWRAASGG